MEYAMKYYFIIIIFYYLFKLNSNVYFSSENFMFFWIFMFFTLHFENLKSALSFWSPIL